MLEALITIILLLSFAVVVLLVALYLSNRAASKERHQYEEHIEDLRQDLEHHHRLEWSSCAWCLDKDALHIDGKCYECEKCGLYDEDTDTNRN